LAFAAATLLTDGEDYVLDWRDGASSSSGVLLRLSGRAPLTLSSWPDRGGAYGGLAWRQGPIWPAIPGSIKVVYTAGYAADAVPADLAQAVNQLAIWLFKNQKS